MRLVYTLILLLMLPVSSQAALKAHGKKGTASTTSAAITPPFFPTRFCIYNEDATNGIYVDWTDGVAATVDLSTNIYIGPAKDKCFDFLPNISPNRAFVVGIIATAATPAYHMTFTRGN